MSRSDNSIKNIFASLMMTFINIFLGFVCQKIFINQLGPTNLGLNGLFTNIISFLSIADLGIGTAIIFNMYKPIAENDNEKIKTLMAFYKKSYRIIAILIFIFGLMISIFLPNIIGKNNINMIDANINIYIIFYLFLVDTVFSYILTYKRSILYADQKNYIISYFHALSLIIMYISQIFFLLTFKNFYLYIIVKILCRIIENILINIKVNKIYPFLLENSVNKLDFDTGKDIKLRVKASIFHNIGGYIVLSTDNLIISRFVGLNAVGLYTNYLLVLNALNSILSQLFNSITSSVGNLLVEKKVDKNKKICDNINYINFWIYCIISCVFYACIQPFIEIWLGRPYLFSNSVAIVLSINFFFQGMRQTMQVFAQAGGICYENRFVPLLESVLNIVFSIIFVKIFGLPGVFVGTIISSFAVHFYSYPKYVYSKLFNRSKTEYVIQFLKKVVVFVCIFIFCIFLISYVKIDNLYVRLIANMFATLFTTSILLFILYKNNEAFSYFKKLILQIVLKLKKRR